MTARLILVCHASTGAVRAAAFPADEPLDDKGMARAAALAGRLPKADRFWSSPELRTRQTAEALRLTRERAAGIARLRLWEMGRDTFDGVHAREPEAVAAWLRDPAAAPHGGESILVLLRRVAAWLAVEQTHHRQSIVVTHPAIIRAAIVQAIEAPPQSFWRIDIAPLSMTRLSGANGRWNLASGGYIGMI